MANRNVIRTLVIGLGSTGTRVCNDIADRIKWEVGGLDRAPWVQFLCAETNAAERSVFNGTPDFYSMSISSDEYQTVLARPHDYDPSLALTKWADLNTLGQLKAGAVDAGAGNIRMVGRLALLWPRNFDAISDKIRDRLDRLRQLSAAEATRTLNEGVVTDATQVSIEPGLRIIIAGTLLGGTCSGTAGDVGIMVRNILNATLDGSNDRIVGMFTLPHPAYGIGQDAMAEVQKANAYHALQELNQYQNFTDPYRFSSIKYHTNQPGVAVLEPTETPFDLIYLARPHEATGSGRASVTSAVAERIFLWAFAPQTDPFATVVNGAPFPPKDGYTFAFSTFGLSTIEYPVRRVMDACKLKVLAHAVKQWSSRTLDSKVEDHLDDLGLSIPNLQDQLLRDEQGGSVRQQLEAQAGKVVAAARRGDVLGARKLLEELRSASARTRGEGLSGLLPRVVESNRSRGADTVVGSAQGVIRDHLLDYQFGPGPLQQILDGVAGRMAQLRGWQPTTAKPEGVNSLLEKIERTAGNTLLAAFWLKEKAIGELVTPLRRALSDEVKARLETAVQAVLVDTSSEKGVLTRTDEELSRARRRLANLQARLSAQVADWQRDAGELERDPGTVNGLTLFEPAPNGTVAKEFANAMPSEKLEGLSASIIKSWRELLTAVAPGVNDGDWLISDYVPGKEAFTDTQLTALEAQAIRPFRDLQDPHNMDVVSRLYARDSAAFNAAKEAAGAADRARLFLPITEVLGQPDNMTPITKSKTLLGSSITPQLQKDIQNWITGSPSAMSVRYDDPFRVVMLQEWHQFALKGASDVTTALAAAKSDMFLTYFSRKRSDIDWTPISDNEIEQLRNAKSLIMQGILNEVLRLDAATLVLPWTDGVGGSSEPGEPVRRFPANLERAARMLAFAPRDVNGLPIANAKAQLASLINAKSTEVIKSEPERAAGFQKYVRYLNKQMKDGNGANVQGWDHERVTRLLLRYFKSNRDLQKAFYTVFPPSEQQIEMLRRHVGDDRPSITGASRGAYTDEGYYCVKCGGPVGPSRQQALDDGLMCSYWPDEPQHPFGYEWDPFAEAAPVVSGEDEPMLDVLGSV